jgi:hypothetical protein
MLFLAVFNSAISVQELPFQDSTKVPSCGGEGNCPPTPRAEVCVPALVAKLYLLAFKSPSSVQDDPFQDSV